MSPERTDFVLTSHVPHSKADILVLHSFDVEPYDDVRDAMIGTLPIVGMVVTSQVVSREKTI
jgi:hypothetical protein